MDKNKILVEFEFDKSWERYYEELPDQCIKDIIGYNDGSFKYKILTKEENDKQNNINTTERNLIKFIDDINCGKIHIYDIPCEILDNLSKTINSLNK